MAHQGIWFQHPPQPTEEEGRGEHGAAGFWVGQARHSSHICIVGRPDVAADVNPRLFAGEVAGFADKRGLAVRWSRPNGIRAWMQALRV